MAGSWFGVYSVYGTEYMPKAVAGKVVEESEWVAVVIAPSTWMWA